jgi:hypothetical protein
VVGDIVSELCQMPLKTCSNSVAYGRTLKDIVGQLNRERNYLGVCWHSPLRKGRFNFQACAIDHSAISPFRINDFQRLGIRIQRIVSDLLICRDRLRAFQYSRPRRIHVPQSRETRPSRSDRHTTSEASQ